jgi:hypothetical protein
MTLSEIAADPRAKAGQEFGRLSYSVKGGYCFLGGMLHWRLPGSFSDSPWNLASKKHYFQCKTCTDWRFVEDVA